MPSTTVLYTFTWKVENFSLSTKKTGEFVSSPEFMVESLDGSVFILRLYPKGKTDDKFVSVDIMRENEDNGPTFLTMGLKLSLVPADGSGAISATCKQREFRRGQSCEYAEFIPRDDIFKKSSMFLVNDTLTLRCDLWKESTEKRLAKECVGRTKIPTERISLVWPVADFSDKSDDFKAVFPVLSASKREHILDLTLTFQNSDDGQGRLVHLDITKLVSKNTGPLFLSCQVSIINCDGQFHDVRKHEHLFEASGEVATWSYPNLKSVKKITSERKILLPNNTLTLFFEFALSSGAETSVIEECSFVTPSCVDFSKRGHTILDDLTSVYKEKKFCDVKLRTNGKFFSAHKLVLCARSPILRKMILPDEADVETPMELDNEVPNGKTATPDDAKESTKEKEVPAESDKDKTSGDKDKASGDKKDGAPSSESETKATDDAVQPATANGKTADSDVEVKDKATSTEDTDTEDKKNGAGDQNKTTDDQVKESDTHPVAMDQDKAADAKETEPSAELNGKIDQETANKNDQDTAVKNDQISETKTVAAKGSSKILGDDGQIVLDVEDVDPITLGQFLQFLYTDTIDDFHFDTAQKLYSASVAYGVEPLKNKCLSYLKSNLAVENICGFLEFADRHKDSSMKQAAQDYINTHMADILLSNEWQNFTKTKRKIAGEVCDELRKKKRKLSL